MRYLGLAAVVGLVLAGPLAAQERQSIGTAHVLNNDFLGDGQDRWRSGGLQISHMRGPEWQGRAPETIGSLLEYRLRAEVIGAANLESPAPRDRPYAGILSFGVHSLSRVGTVDLSLGGDLVFTGPNTGIGEFRMSLHEWMNAPVPNLSNEIGNGVYPTVSITASKTYSLGGTQMRPFAEAQAGYETYVRVGADLLFGGFAQGGLLSRDVTTGHLIRADNDAADGLSFLLGGMWPMWRTVFCCRLRMAMS